MSYFKTTYIENCTEEIEIEVEADYTPYDYSTNYPETIDICGIYLNGNQNNEICLLPDEKARMEEEMHEFILEEIDYNKYGYMMQ